MKKSFLPIFVIAALLSPIFASQPDIRTAEAADTQVDYALYEKYNLFLNYQKKQKYLQYLKYKKNKEKYGFESSAEKFKAKEGYEKYKQYKKNPSKYAGNAKYRDQYKKYSNYKKYVSEYSEYSRYSKYNKYNKAEYDKGKAYGTAKYKAGYDRYVAAQKKLARNFGEANLGCGIKDPTDGKTCLGPEISVGLYSYKKSELDDSSFRIKANKDYNIKDSTGAILGTIAADTYTKVKYASNGDFRVYESIAETIVPEVVQFDAADNDNTSMVFDINYPDSDFDQYRGKMKLQFYEASESSDDRIWVINTLPLEQYTWGMGEITGTGDEDHNRVMTTIYRTYGYWKIRFSTKYAAQGFKVTDDSSSQIYYGYDWELSHPKIKEAAQETRGKLVMFLDGDLNEIALSPYSSWTDGKTRSFEERWGSDEYPWCKSVADSHGKHPSMKTVELEAAGNHMVGLSAHGSLDLASEHDWAWDRILKYYFSGVNLLTAY